MTDWNGTTTISRDLLNRITDINDHKGRNTGYVWDEIGNLTAITFPDGTSNAYTYDAEGNMAQLRSSQGRNERVCALWK